MHKIRNSFLLAATTLAMGCAPSLGHTMTSDAPSGLGLQIGGQALSISPANGQGSEPRVGESEQEVPEGRSSRRSPVGVLGGIGLPLVVAGVPLMIWGGVGMGLGTTYSERRSDRHGYPVELNYGYYGTMSLVGGVVATAVGIPLIITDVVLQKKSSRQQARIKPSFSPRGFGIRF